MGFVDKDPKARKAFAAATGHLLLTGGMMGLPMAQVLDAITGLFSDDDKRASDLFSDIAASLAEFAGADAETGGYIADIALLGLPALLGLDVSRNIGLGDAYIQYDGTAPKLTSFLGAGANFGLNVMNETGKAWLRQRSYDDPWDFSNFLENAEELARRAAPQAVRQFIQIKDSLNDQLRDRQGNLISDEVSTTQKIGKAVGFRTTDERVAQRENRRLSDAAESGRLDRGAAVQIAAKQLAEGTAGEAQSTIAAYLARSTEDPQDVVDAVYKAYESYTSGRRRPLSISQIDTALETQRVHPHKRPSRSSVDRLRDMQDIYAELAEFAPQAYYAKLKPSAYKQAILEDMQLEDYGIDPDIARALRKREEIEAMR
jgi:hypothetical protein